MPIEEPPAHGIVKTLRNALTKLHALAAAEPGNAAVVVALAHTAAAIAAVEILNPNPQDSQG